MEMSRVRSTEEGRWGLVSRVVDDDVEIWEYKFRVLVLLFFFFFLKID